MEKHGSFKRSERSNLMLSNFLEDLLELSLEHWTNLFVLRLINLNPDVTFSIFIPQVALLS